MNTNWKCYALVLITVIVSSCEKREQKRGYLARVGDSYLTEEQVEGAGDSSIISSNTRLREYVSQWVNNELLYQEAKRQRVENSEDFQKLLSSTRKRLSIETMLEKELYQDSMEIPEDSISAYFESHLNDFLLQDDAIKLRMVAFATREPANSFRTKVVDCSLWEAALESLLNDSALQKSVLVNTNEKYFTQHTLYPTELWRVANNLGAKEISFPIRTQAGYYIIQPLAFLRRGLRADIALARDEIRQRLIIEHRRAQYNELLSHLRSKYEVEITIP